MLISLDLTVYTDAYSLQLHFTFGSWNNAAKPDLVLYDKIYNVQNVQIIEV